MASATDQSKETKGNVSKALSKTENPKDPNAVTALVDRRTTFKPLASPDEIVLSVGLVRSMLAQPTKKGNLPSDVDIVRFIQLCKARQLNPWEGDCWLLGYEQTTGPNGQSEPVFDLVTSYQALLKRAELNDDYDGMEAGMLLKKDKEGEVEEREGAFTLEGEIIVGGWARVYRTDRTRPASIQLKRSVYDTGKSRWKKDPGGMIRKCAAAAALREAFPNTCGGMYTEDEFDGWSANQESSALTHKPQERNKQKQLPPGQTAIKPEEIFANAPKPPEERSQQQASPEPESCVVSTELTDDWQATPAPDKLQGETPEDFAGKDNLALLASLTDAASVEIWTKGCIEAGWQPQAVEYFAKDMLRKLQPEAGENDDHGPAGADG